MIGQAAGYHGRAVLKAPVWTWEVPTYFFVGGTAGMSAVIALGSLFGDDSLLLTRVALWIALIGALLSPPLLILDLGRPLRFLNMLRVFKWRSPMSVGVWTLVLFSTLAAASVFLFEGYGYFATTVGVPTEVLSALLTVLILLLALLGAVLATYTGVLLGVTAVPVWAAHRTLLPCHAGLAGLGSATSVLILLGARFDALTVLMGVVALAETGILARTELRGRADRDASLWAGPAATRLRVAGLLMGPVPLGAMMVGVLGGGALAFMLGALISRYAWMGLGRASAQDPTAALR